MELMPDIRIIEEEKDDVVEEVLEEAIDMKEETKLEEKEIKIEEEVSPDQKETDPFVKKKKSRKKKTEKIINEILQENETLLNLNESTFHKKELDETRQLIKDCIKDELVNVKQHKNVKRTRKVKPMTAKQEAHMINMRRIRIEKKEERERLLNLEAELKELKEYRKEKASSPPKHTPSKIIPPPQKPVPKPAPAPTPPQTNVVERIIPKVYNPFDQYF
jgi:hypothetical protein